MLTVGTEIQIEDEMEGRPKRIAEVGMENQMERKTKNPMD